MTVLWKCDDCGGPAVWTMIDDHPHYHCEQQCDGFMQQEMALDDSRSSRYIDSVRSVSALDGDGDGPIWCDPVLEDQHRRFLNGS